MELTPSELAAWRGFLRVHAALTRELDHELETTHGLPLSSYEVLITLQSAPGRRLRMAELADRVLLSRSGMTRLIDRLERSGLVKRDQCGADARGSYACLTDNGLALIGRVRPKHLADVRDRFLSHLDESDMQRLGELWERMLPGATSDVAKT
jgi:DNA-binding MarR family transcriptional regulator